jgi:hypothetical protein
MNFISCTAWFDISYNYWFICFLVILKRKFLQKLFSFFFMLLVYAVQLSHIVLSLVHMDLLCLYFHCGFNF